MKKIKFLASLWSYVLPICLICSACNPSNESEKESSAVSEKFIEEKEEPTYKSEQEYLVEHILDTISQFNHYVTSQDSDDLGESRISATRSNKEFPPSFQISIQTGEQIESQELTLSKYIWEPDNYTSFFNHASQNVDASNTIPKEILLSEQLLIQEQTGYTDPLLYEANERISKWISEYPLSQSLHEQAAFLLAIMANREAAGRFSDYRRVLCSISAHLAIARSLMKEDESPGLCGQFADIILLNCAGRSAEALEKLENVQTTDESSLDKWSQSWLVALKTRITRDWRLIQVSSGMTNLERISGYREYCAMIGVTNARNRFGIQALADKNDFSRIGLIFGPSVEDGHFFLEAGLSNEFSVLSEIYFDSLDELFSKKILIGLLNNKRSGPIVGSSTNGHKVEIISPEIWGKYFQRHLVHTSAGNLRFLYRSLGSKEDGRVFESEITEFFRELNYFPFLTYHITGVILDRHEPYEKLLDMMAQKPMDVPMCYWMYTITNRKDNNVPDPILFCKDIMPFGTAIDFSNRLPMLDEADFTRIAHAQDAYKIDIYDHYLIWNKIYLESIGNPSESEIIKDSHDMLDYSVFLNQKLLTCYVNNPEKYTATSLKIAGYRPNQYITLARYHAERERESDAVQYFEKAIVHATDTVALSNNLSWLADYYLKENQLKDALRVADIAGETYSSRGLFTMGKVYAHAKKWRQAEQIFLARQERYNSSDGLLGFYRMAAEQSKDQRYIEEFKKLQAELFPTGFRKVTLADFQGKGAPQQGTLFKGNSQLLTNAGLGHGAIVVALDGIQVFDHHQYGYLRTSNFSKELDLIVYYEGEYKRVKASPPNKLFGITVLTHDSKVQE